MTCYICLEDGDDMLHNVCDCKNSAVHTACLVKWIEQSKKAECSVCARHFQGVDVTTHQEHRHDVVHKYVHMVVLLVLCASPSYFLVHELIRTVVTGRTGGTVALSFVCVYITILFLLIAISYKTPPPRRVICTTRLQDLALTV